MGEERREIEDSKRMNEYPSKNFSDVRANGSFPSPCETDLLMQYAVSEDEGT
jgi:hypothetical protein